MVALARADHGRRVADDERAAVLDGADSVLHLDPLELDVLLRRQAEALAVGVVGSGPSSFSGLTGLLRLLGLPFGDLALLFLRGLDPLVTDRVRRVGFAHGDLDQLNRQAGGLDVLLHLRRHLVVDRVDRRRGDRGLVHAVLAHGLANAVAELALDVVGVDVHAELGHQEHGVRDPPPDDAVEAQGDAVGRHQVVELLLRLNRQHIDLDGLRRQGGVLRSGSDRIGHNAPVTEEPGLPNEHSLFAGVRGDPIAGSGHGEGAQGTRQNQNFLETHESTSFAEWNLLFLL